MIVTIADQYLAQNAGRRYPLADDTTGIADNAIVDFRCVVRGATAGSVPFAKITGIAATTANSVSVKRVSVDVGYASTTVASLSFDIPVNMATNAMYTAYSENGNASSALTVTAAILTATVPTGGVQFAKTTVILDSLKVASIQAASAVETGMTTADFMACVTLASSYTAVLTGDIVLDNGFNSEPYLDGNKLHLDIAKGNGIGEKCQSAAAGQTCDNVMFSINGERPGSDGEIKLVGESGVVITPVPSENAIDISLDTTAENTMTGTCDTICS